MIATSAKSSRLHTDPHNDDGKLVAVGELMQTNTSIMGIQNVSSSVHKEEKFSLEKQFLNLMNVSICK